MRDHNIFRDPEGRELARLFQMVEQGEMTPEECLEQYPQHQAELSELFQLAARLKSTELPGPDPRFRAAARARIIEQVTARERVSLLDGLRGFWHGVLGSLRARPVFAAALIAVLVFSLTGAGSVFAAQEAVPGELLYPLKLQVEDFRLAVAPDEVDEALYREFAAARVDEVAALIRQGRYDRVTPAVERLDDLLNHAAAALERAPEAGRAETIAGLADSLAAVNALLDQVPEAARPGLENALEHSARAREKLEKLAPQAPTRQPPAQSGEPEPAGKPDESPAAQPKGGPDRSPSGLPTQAQGQGNGPGKNSGKGQDDQPPAGEEEAPGNQEPPGKQNAPGQNKPDKQPTENPGKSPGANPGKGKPPAPPGQQKTKQPGRP